MAGNDYGRFVCPLCGTFTAMYWSHLDTHGYDHQRVKAVIGADHMCVCGQGFPAIHDRNAHFAIHGRECVLILELGGV